MKLNWGIFKSTVSFILAFSLGIGMVGSRSFAISDEEKADVIRQAEQYLKDNGLRFSKEDSKEENKEPKDLSCDAEDLRKKVDRIKRYINDNRKFFPSENIIWLEEKLSEVEDETLFRVFKLKLKNPYYMLFNSVFTGWVGMDRFSIKSFGLGITKLAISAFVTTSALCCDGSDYEKARVLSGALLISFFEPFNVYDVVNIMEKTRQYNFKKVMEVIREDF